MPRIFSYLACLAMLTLAVSVHAAEGDGEVKKVRGPRPAGANKEEILKKFDKDGDGKLSDDEKAAAKKEFGERGGRPGGLDKAALMKKFDKDGDGKLSDDEKAAAKKAMQERGRGPGKKPADK
ncbi:MAG TPA: EF-hand domain-containing protein [Pirellulaceae bacterium]|nr:EF-hand domain-containing protein [Pirellulaceae bacterium]